MSTLPHKTVIGLLSTGLSKVVLAVAGLVVTVVLAKQLKPADFGLVGMATVFTGFLTMLGGLGFDSAIIQKQQISQRQLSTLFWIRVLVGVLCAGLLALAAPAISGFYREPRLVGITQVLSLIFVTSSVYQMNRSILRKELRFSIIAVITVCSVIASGFAGVTLACLGGGVWSLVVQPLILELVSAILYWRASSWRPDLAFAWHETLPVIRFGLTMAAGSFVLYVQRNIDSLLIGRLLGVTALGYYALAYRMMYAPVRQISYVFTDVLFPSLSTIQNDTKALNRGFSRSVKFVALVTFPAMTLVALFSREIVEVAFGAQWAPAAAVIGILAPAGALQSVTQLAYVVFPVVGRPRLSVVQYVVGCVSLAVGVIVGSRWGVVGTAWGVVASAVIAWVFAQYLLNRLLAMGTREVVEALGKTVGSCVLMVVVRLMTGQGSGWGSASVWLLLANILLCLSVYCICLFLFEKPELIFLRDLVRRTIVDRLRQREDPAAVSPKVGQIEIPSESR